MKIEIEDVLIRSEKIKNNHIIYFLLLDGEVVYVGQTKDIFTRTMSHMKSDKIFNEISIFDVPLDEADEAEADAIVKFNSKYNLSIPDCHKYIKGKDLR